MASSLKLLVVEDSHDDAEIIVHELRHLGYDPNWSRVESEHDFLEALKTSPQLVISDYSMPQFSGLRAAELLRKSGLNIPFILISGTVGEDVAVDAMRRGVTDYLLKGRLARLGPAVDHALREALAREKSKQTETERNRLAAILEATPDMVGFSDPEGRILYVNGAGRKMLGVDPDEDVTKTIIADFIPDPGNNPILAEGVPTAICQGMWGGESVLLSRNGQKIPVSQVIVAHKAPDGTLEFLSTIIRDITERKHAEFELEQMHAQLLAASRQAAVAEFTTGVLHNVGNVLNSVNVATTCLSDSLKKSKSASLGKVVALMRQHEADLGTFFSHDPKGKQLPGYLAQLADHLAGEHASALRELAELQKNVEHIKNIISVQQDSTKVSHFSEVVKLKDLVEDALRMNANALMRAGITVNKEFQEIPAFTTERHTVLQILVNLVRNAIQAIESLSAQQKHLAIRVTQEAGRARISVTDNGSGILPENLPRIFTHGFTTKKNGHGFGLHGAALAAKELGGSLVVQSEGSGRGATFTLELPIKD